MPNITIDAAAASLNLHQRLYDKKIEQRMKLKMETEASLSQVRCTHTYVAPNAEIQRVLQAYQCDFTPNLSVDFDAVENTLQRMKIDVLFECDDLDGFVDSWQAEWVEDGKERDVWTLPRYIYEEILMPQLEDDMELVSFNGVRAEPTVGTAGVTINAVDGLKVKVRNAINAGLLTPIPTGALTQTGLVNQTENFCDAIPISYRDMPGEIKMSKTNARRYWRDYRSEFGTPKGNENTQNDALRVDATNKTVKGYSSMEGSDSIIFTPRRNAIVGRKKGEARLPRIRWQVVDRKLKGLAEFSRFYGFRFWGNTFVNDQFAV